MSTNNDDPPVNVRFISSLSLRTRKSIDSRRAFRGTISNRSEAQRSGSFKVSFFQPRKRAHSPDALAERPRVLSIEQIFDRYKEAFDAIAEGHVSLRCIYRIPKTLAVGGDRPRVRRPRA